MLTETEIAFSLGLEPWQTLEDKAKADGVYPRRSGRSTRMLVQAVAAAQTKKVAISAFSHALTRDYVFRARQMCDHLGIDPSNIVECYPSSKIGERLRLRGTNTRIFRDHYLGSKFPES